MVNLFCRFNPILGREGHYGPDDHERPRCFCRVRDTTTKIHDFISVYVWIVPWKSFFGFVLKFLENRKIFFWISTSNGPPFGKKIENFKKKFFFCKKSYFFFLNSHCKCSKLSFDVYNSHVTKKIKFWHIFAWKFSFFTIVFWHLDWPKLQLRECCFWCLWTAKDQENLMEVIFWLYDAHWQPQDG